jgi:DNA polymerase III subunit chi
MPTEVNFYHLTRDTLEAALPKLAARAYASGLRTVIRAGDEARVQALDGLLWTFEDDSFLPHGTPRNGHGDLQPIYISSGTEVPNAARLLMLVDGRLDDDINTFDRCFYLFDARDDEQVSRARQAWKQLKSAGVSLTYWQQDDSGRWQKRET